MTMPARVGEPAQAGSVPAALDRARDVVRPAIRERVGRLSPELRRVAEYHFGFTDAEGRPASVDGGKAVRAALALLSAAAAGAPVAEGVRGAVAVELVHNFSLLHDDVMDRDRERRHRPTAWTLFGIGQAIVGGDALLALAQEILLEEPTPERVRAGSALTAATVRMIAGQSRDLAFESREHVSVEECIAMCADKTGALLAMASSIGAILAGAPEPTAAALGEFGLHLGLAFQAIDDVLGIWGRPEVTGKPAANDLRQRKKTLPVVAALSSGRPEAAELGRILSGRHPSEDEAEEAAGLVEAAGGRAWALAEADRRTGLAIGALRRASVEPVSEAELIEVARFVTAREF